MVIIASGSGAAERRIILLGGHPMHSLEPQFEILPHVNSSMLHRLRTQGTVYHYFTLLKNKKKVQIPWKHNPGLETDRSELLRNFQNFVGPALVRSETFKNFTRP